MRDPCVGHEARRIWLAWERQRRSETLAAVFRAAYLPLTSAAARPWKYFCLAFRTVLLLIRKRPTLVFVQNPSVVLACIVCALRGPLGYRVVMDRHSNLKPHTRNSKALIWRGFHTLSRYSNRAADLTIVTNEGIADLVRQDGGRAAILQDRLPDMESKAEFTTDAARSAVFICTFSDDEPVAEVMRAVAIASPPTKLFVTGRPKLTGELEALLDAAKDRIVLTGFIPDAEYKALVASVDYAIVLTTAEDTLVCGAYEALACSKPVVLADTRALRDYFRRGTIFCLPVAADIARAMTEMNARYAEMQSDALSQRSWMSEDWRLRHAALLAAMEPLLESAHRP